MKYLVTGHKGFIGTNLINYLDKFGYDVDGVDYPTDLCSVKINSPFDTVIHLAAETDPRNSIKDPEKVFIRNCQSTINVLEMARKFYARVVFVSSCGASYSTNPYTASKLACEAICNAYRESYKMDVTILRFSNVYGPHSRHKNSVIHKFIKAKLANEPVKVYGTGHQTRDFIYVDDICKAICECSGDLVEISTGVLTSINTIIEMLEINEVIHESSVDGDVFHPETKPWSDYEVDLKSGLELTLKWYQDN